MAGCTALSIATKSHKDRRSKSVSVQEILPHRLKDDRLLLLVITNNQEYSPLSSAAVSATCSKTCGLKLAFLAFPRWALA